MVGINIQTPWSGLLINGSKTVETRSYHLPFKYLGVELALVETPGKSGRFKSRIIGTITFSESFKYDNKQQWMEDYLRHKVDVADRNYGWGNKAKYGWLDITTFIDYTPIEQVESLTRKMFGCGS